MQIVIKNLKYLIINILLSIVNVLIPRRKDLWVIGGWFGKRFADNSKYLYLYLSQNKQKINLNRVVWITDDKKIFKNLKAKGYDVEFKNSIKGIWIQLRSKVHIVDNNPKEDINGILSLGALKINLWHGIPLKKIGNFSNPNYSQNNIIKNIKRNILKGLSTPGKWENCYYLATSEYIGYLMKEAFCNENDKIIITNYPRNDFMMTNSINNVILNGEKKFIDNIQAHKYIKIIGYFPTFRENKRQCNFNRENLQKINKYLEKNKYMLVTKFHLADKQNININNYSNIINLPPYFDIYNIIKKLDVLVTDYSSIAFDFILLNRKIIYYVYDLEEYIKNERDFLLDFNKYTFGVKVKNIRELICEIENENTYKEYNEKFYNIKHKLYSKNEFGCVNIAEWINKKIN